MKKHFYFLLSALALILSACSEELNEFQKGDLEITTINVSARNFEGSTRTAISKESYSVSWGDKDIIGIFPMEEKSKQIAFELSGGENSQNATFDGRGWGFKSGMKYAAYYPYQRDGLLDKTAIELDYTGQKQTANGSTDHLGDYDFLVATTTSPINGALNFEFQHISTLVHLVMNVPNGNYSKVELHTDGDFYSKAILNMETGETLTDEESVTKTLTLDLDNVSVTNGKLEIFTMVYPVDLEGHNIYAYAYDEDGNNRASSTWDGIMLKPGTIWSGTSELAIIPYLTFKADQAQTLQMTRAIETLQYSVNGGEWKELGTNKVNFGGSNGDLRLRGKSSTGTANYNRDYSMINFGNTNPVYSSGDIRTLVDYENYSTVSTAKASFCMLFNLCRNLITAPELPATDLADYCYFEMFWCCESLTEAPALPATTVKERCYSFMFTGCENLAKAPELPATKLARWCYSSMFSGCKNLAKAPHLPATTLAEYCYQGMFSLCTSLTEAPDLPATTLAGCCYQGMFSGCSSLTKAPELPATNLANSCYSSMFQGCQKLTEAPELPATNLANSCYSSMFSECKGLDKAPDLPATTLFDYCYEAMFLGCTKLSEAAELPIFLQNTALVKTWINRSVGIQGLFAGLPVTDEYLHSVLPHNESGKYYLPRGNCRSMFEGCTLLKTAPELPATELEMQCYYSMFSGCTSLTEAPSKLPATTLNSYCYSNMFRGCSSLTKAPELPATTLNSYCYSNMFRGCTNLTEAPELPAIELARWCYSNMFSGCSKLSYIKMLATDISATNCLDGWTYGVSSTGTFVKNAAATWNVNGSNGIPSGWTLVTAIE